MVVNGYKTKTTTKMPDTVLGVALVQITLHLNAVKEFIVPKNCKQNGVKKYIFMKQMFPFLCVIFPHLL